ncbi:MAG TPA: DNA-3-methyladenine glycosylase I [Fimbriimonas sp.]|nr:DNA-3-methyladenine glycosylase I [Fimbriimonas sp.]
MASSYCTYVAGGSANPLHGEYHDREYGFAVESDDVLFERLILEVNQAGLSWETILKRREGFREAYDQFAVSKIANYGDGDIERLLSDSAIIRNRLKVLAAIHNAQVVQELQNEFGSFKAWLDSLPSMDLSEWVRLFRSKFKFTGPEIVREFLVSTGYLPGAHDEDCPIYAVALASKPRWSAP